MARKRLGEILVNAGVLQEAQLRAALAEQRRWGGPLGRLLVEMKAISEEVMVQALSHQLNLPAVNLEKLQVSSDALDLVSADIAEQHSVVPFQVQGRFLDVAMSDPTNLGIIDELRIRTKLNVRPYLAGPKAIERAIARFYGRGLATIDFGGSSSPSMAGAELDARRAAAQASTPVSIGGPADQSAGQSAAAARRAQQFEFSETASREAEQQREISSLQSRVQTLEALVQRDEDVLRKLLALMIEKGLATREEILERLK
jgi:hypothetical protein